MSHLHETRFVVLAEQWGTSPDPEEAAHLARCASCTARLQQERELTEALLSLMQPSAPDDFGWALTARFRDSVNARTHRWIMTCVAVSVALGALLAVPTLWLLAINLGPIVTQTVRFARELLVVAGTAETVFSAVPVLAGPLLVAATAPMLAAAWAWGRATLALGSAAEPK